VQGFPDTLFDVDQAAANYAGIKANGQPVKLWLYDGGHAGPGTQGGLISGVVIDWFDCYLATTAACDDVGPEVEYYTGGVWKSAPSWPLPAQNSHMKAFDGVPPLFGAPIPTASQGSWTFALEQGASGDDLTHATGGATFEAKVRTTGDEAFLFASIGVRNAAGTVTRIGEQTQPFRAAPGNGVADVSIELVDVSAAYAATDTLVLTVATGDRDYDNARTAGFVYLEDVKLVWQSTRT
jgi:hypothetical protein